MWVLPIPVSPWMAVCVAASRDAGRGDVLPETPRWDFGM